MRVTSPARHRAFPGMAAQEDTAIFCVRLLHELWLCSHVNVLWPKAPSTCARGLSTCSLRGLLCSHHENVCNMLSVLATFPEAARRIDHAQHQLFGSHTTCPCALSNLHQLRRLCKHYERRRINFIIIPLRMQHASPHLNLHLHQVMRLIDIIFGES